MTPTSLCNGIGFDDTHFVDDTNHFSWQTMDDILELKFDFLVSYKSDIDSPTYLYSDVSFNSNVISYKYKIDGTQLILLYEHQILFGVVIDTLIYNR